MACRGCRALKGWHTALATSWGPCMTGLRNTWGPLQALAGRTSDQAASCPPPWVPACAWPQPQLPQQREGGEGQRAATTQAAADTDSAGHRQHAGAGRSLLQSLLCLRQRARASVALGCAYCCMLRVNGIRCVCCQGSGSSTLVEEPVRSRAYSDQVKDAAATQLLTRELCLTVGASPCTQALTDLISSSSSESEHGRRSNSCDGRDSLSAVLAAAELTFGGSSSGSCSSEEPPRGSSGTFGRNPACGR